MNARVLKIHPGDNVLVALTNLKKGEVIEHNGNSYTLVDDVNAKHKFFIGDMKAADAVYMYGVLVGKTQLDVPRGARMTTENTKHAAGVNRCVYCSAAVITHNNTRFFAHIKIFFCCFIKHKNICG